MDNFLNFKSIFINHLSAFTLLFAVLSGIFFILLFVQQIRFSKKLKNVRSDAIKRSRAVLTGQLTEQVAPFLPNFPCKPGDVQFLGKPVDFVAFCGLSESDTVDEILFIEVKTGTSALSGREKQVRKAVEEGRVRYVEYRMKA